MRRYRIGRFETEGVRDALRSTLLAGHVIFGAGVLAPAMAWAPLRSAQRMAKSWAKVAIRLTGMRPTINGLDNAAPNRRYVVVPLHEGFADAVLLSELPLMLRFVARDELFDWPLMGRALRLTGQLVVRPEQRILGIRRLLEEMAASFDRGESVVMFPQGSILGIETSFRVGPFRIADRLGIPVLPVVITGTHRVWEHPYSDRLRFGQAVEMTVMTPLPAGNAANEARKLESRMKEIALTRHQAPPRRFDPDRDGFWDGYDYDIDPAFPELESRVSAHRSANRVSR